MADAETRVRQYVELRDKIKELDDEHKTAMKPYRETLEQLNSALLQQLNTIGADSVATPAGTFYRTEKKSASIADGDTFWSFILQTQAWDLIDRKANVTAVAAFIEANHQPPPGINWSSRYETGVRRK